MTPRELPAPWLRSAYGERIDITRPESAVIHLPTIAASLSRLCRFGGHLRDGVEAYSVAEHSLFVGHIVGPRLRFAGFLHDAAEAYLGADMPAPVKALFPAYKALEARWQARIFAAFGVVLTDDDHAALKTADRVAYLTERRDLLADAAYTADGFWDAPDMGGLAPVAERIRPERDRSRVAPAFLGALRLAQQGLL